mmetsp:Transcript_39912/g.96065  ORF Transcript_39912/g.96065 Transcript_39912/m.96065 type:complete len:1105 (+) Transcript_39912:280-3594(+)|eukprot:CAMPEP_0181137546 /NCGR_PEP_ID=MMETSP1071-20121207/33762_1 /TAXON_ID=35127 /ORGANISM="Thalassiosira sp., Strain NH16" /LENGTH=1104 /DNA_ID=CAMNT_0023224305 /DNA_START=238 /DNA_END=3552 /DNA_ORIENTATION=-
MVKYALAALAILSTAHACAAVAPSSAFANHPASSRRTIIRPYSNSRRYSAIPYDEFGENDDQGLPSFPSPAGLLEIPEDNQEDIDALLAKKEKRRVARIQQTRKPGYQVTLPIRGSLVQPPRLTTGENIGSTNDDGETLSSLVAKGQEIAVANTIGMSLRQVYRGRKLSELALDVDTLRFQSFMDELQGRRVDEETESDLAVTTEGMEGEINELPNSLDSVQVLQNHALEMMKESFDGVVVSSVAQGGLAWEAGVRAGDVLTATSATIGGKLWPKSTLDGVRSAISSRKVISPSMEFQFRRLASEKMDGEEGVHSFELSLSRPIGINVDDTDDGFITIMGISDKASSIVKDNLRVGDRVISVESSVGSKMWDVYSTDGLTSAVTSRLPGQPVRIIFERLGEAEEVTSAVEEIPASPVSSMSNAVVGFRHADKSVSTSDSLASTSSAVRQQAAPQNASQKMLLSRSRDLLRTYIARNEVTKNIKVADRVLEAVMDASAVLDGKTLNLVMKAYNTCNNAEKAIHTFEEVFNLAGDGSQKEVEQIHGGAMQADITALNVYTISGLLRAHAIRGDYESALRVLAAMEGNADFSIKGVTARPWSGKGDPLSMLPDTRCYNIALAAAAKSGTDEGLRAALDIFDSMPNPSLNNPPLGKPAKNLVTFNTMINAFAIAGQYQNAYGVFQTLKKSSLRPDRVTYTTLLKASIKIGDLEKALDILDDMKWIGIQPDIVSYNNIIQSLCNANRLFEAKDLVNEMETTQVTPDSMTYGLLMKGLLRANKPGPCLTLFESACADARTAELTENVQLYTTAISAAAALGDHERALDLVSRMNRAGVKPNKKTLTALMGACIAGRKYDAAANIFSKIKNPDGFAMSVGLKALCLAGNFDAALELITEQRSGHKILKGKQVMAGYTNLIEEALFSRDFDVAREALTGLLRAGYIPSKATFIAMIEGLDLQTDMPLTSAAMRKRADSQPSDEKFEFLLFVLDSLEGRKLTADSAFYSSILVMAAQAGGLQKAIASLLARSRKSGDHKEIKISEMASPEDLPSHQIASWEDLFKNYSTHKENMGPSTNFPSVRVSTKDFGRVLAAERAVVYRGGQRTGFTRR